MIALFAFWTVDRHGRPTHPDAADPWGDRSPFDALENRQVGAANDRETVGPWLTVADEATGAVHFAGDVSGALRSFAAEVYERAGFTPKPDADPVDAALEACNVLASEAADEWGREAVYDWCEPNPDTSRSPRRMPEQTRRNIHEGAQKVGREVAADALRDHLLARALPARRAA